MSSDKLKTVKNFKLTEENLLDLQQKLQEIKTRPIETEQLPNGDAIISKEYQMDKMIDIGILSLEMNIAMMKNALAIHIEHELNEEITMDKMDAMIQQALSKFGINKNDGT